MLAEGFPNMLMVLGPHTARGNITQAISHSAEFQAGLLRFMQQHNYTHVETRPEKVDEWTRIVIKADARRGSQRRLPGIRVPVVLRVRSGPVSGVGSHNSVTVRVMMGLPHDLFKIVRALSTGGALDQSKCVAMGRFIEDTPRPARGSLSRSPR